MARITSFLASTEDGDVSFFEQTKSTFSPLNVSIYGGYSTAREWIAEIHKFCRDENRLVRIEEEDVDAGHFPNGRVNRTNLPDRSFVHFDRLSTDLKQAFVAAAAEGIEWPFEKNGDNLTGVEITHWIKMNTLRIQHGLLSPLFMHLEGIIMPIHIVRPDPANKIVGRDPANKTRWILVRRQAANLLS